MKAIKITLATLLFSTLSFAQVKEVKAAPTAVAVENVAPSKISWQKDNHDFGTLEKGKPASYEFTFTNTTNETILITNVRPSCGCTAANYTKTPIKPGEKGFVTATYNAASPGSFTKTITVTTNDSTVPKSLVIKGKVDAPEEVKSPILK